MHEALVGVEAKLDRASVHLQSVKDVLRDYLTKDPYLLTGNIDAEGRGPITITGTTPPNELATAAGDCLFNLRSALEYLARQLVEASNQHPNKDTHFPIMAIAPERDRHNQIPTPQIPPQVTSQIRRLLATLQPYTWEDEFFNHPLYVLAKLNNLDKHQMLTFGGYSIGQPRLITGAGSGEWKALRILEDGAEFGLVDQVDMEVKCKLTTHVCFRETEPGAQPRPIVRSLAQILRFIRVNVLGPFERDIFV